MRSDWDNALARWTDAGLLDAAAAARIREWESARTPSVGLRWPVWLALALGAILLGAGVLLFVSAHWDQLSPGQRMALVILMVAGFHAGGAAVAERFQPLSITLHAVGTVALGAGIALTGQIFQLQEHWPSAILLWAIGAALTWAILGHWTQGALVALLVPYWLCGEWTSRAVADDYLPVWVGVCALSFTCLTARRDGADSPLRKALAWVGGFALLPSAAAVALVDAKGQYVFALAIALGAPLALAWFLRGRAAIWNVVATLWVGMLAGLHSNGPDNVAIYAWCALGAAGLAFWGIAEARSERVNLGVAGFAITVLCFYFSSVMDKLERSASLIGLGILFLGGGWALERMRRHLIAQIREAA